MNPQLAGLANNTKWNELQQFMSELGQRAPYWRTKATNGFIYPPQGWDGDWTYHFRLGEHKLIEWCEMQSRATEGALTMSETLDICRRIGFEIEILESSIKVIGYRRL
ncbi:DUF6678 family protein [Pseudomonas sp. M30-35]|uniref:DUF6678 family protein n=1 Tax=Pseudomonas sp. M30-35 TaxID=1981174 RepID=UPI000B3CE194|nr:DUF6678 family protein [Pseudomonas sp. M30-35]ARU89891.1 hypothetical protein B9K09_18800 [Pseudomonas sp. M30-35]